ncbi:MATE family efflux transporter [Paludicola sp. MB14-C6]|uniref:MATE family efflux transporter n=1 Tax=Paludihabitans sp. MB14-C6 TaxID=3070656 RepID=UPI0027DCDC1F|nr:MATE family efflux transporter [Paludicola sp. MB14-C6]WMJ23531.1 MATE family efflux transporter [Paludicola sp. MB14-C6]
MTKPKIVREKEFYKTLLTIALPVTLQNLIIFCTQMLDTVMLGELGDVAMSASALANQPFFIFNLLTFGLSGGAAVITAQYWGKREIEPIKIIMTMIIRFAMIMGMIFSIAVLVFPSQIMWIFTKDSQVIQAGVEYLQIIAFSYFFFGFTNTFYSTIRSVEIVKIAVVSNVLALVINGSLNYILIFGHFGAPALGIKGAALATLIARICEFSLGVLFMFFFDKKLKIRPKDFLKFDKILFQDLIKISSPVVANELMWSLGMTMQAALMGNLGKHVVSANSIISVVQQLSTVAVFGVASAAAVMIGKAIGEGDMQKARDRGHTFKIISIIFGVFVTVVIILLRNVAIDFYNVSAQAKALAHQLIYISALIGFFVSIAGIGIVGILRGGGDTKFSLWIEIAALWGIAVPFAYLAAFVLKWPVPAVYCVMKIDEPVKDTLCLIRMRGTRWLKNVTRDNLEV